MRKNVIALALMGALGSFGGLAWAQGGGGWGDYGAAFPDYPCQDGWMGCIQGGDRLDPGIQKDKSGMPMPADLRLGWFDLEPTKNFSAFVQLSKYTGEQPSRIGDEPAVATAPNPDPDNPEATPEPGGDPVDNDGQVDIFDPEAEAARRESEKRRLEEIEANRRQQEATEESARAAAEADRAREEAESRAKAAEAARLAAQRAQDDAERQRLEEQARRAREEEERARRQAEEAERLRKEREAQEAEQRRLATAAAAEARKAEEERKRREAEEQRKAEERRKAEEAERAKAEAAAQQAAAAARAKAEAEAKKQAEEAARKAAAAAEAASAAADEAERKRLEEEQRKLEEQRKKAEAEAKKQAEEAARKAEEESRAKAQAEAAARAEAERKRQEEERRKFEEEQRQKEAEEAGGGEASEAAVAGAGDCADLVALETKAILGQLSNEQTVCLETSLKNSTKMTQKSKVSRMLMVNAFSAGDKKTWESLIKRHLQDIEQSDPDLCYKYALHLSRKGPGSQYGVIRWANVALENRTVWTGSTYTSRVYSLYKIRAAAAQKIWQDLESKHASSPTEESNQQVKDARNQTKVFAREWYEYAKVAGKDVTTALDLCMSAAGTKDYCEAG